MKIHNRHLPLVRETTLDMIGVRRFNGEGGSGGSGGDSTGGSGSGGQGDGGNAGGSGGTGGGTGSGSGSSSSSGSQNGNEGKKSAGQGGNNGQSGQGGNSGQAGTKRKLEDLTHEELVGVARELREEAAGSRTKKNEAATELTELQKGVAKLLGVDVDGDGKPDPEKLATDLGAATTKIRDLQVENALYHVADEAGGDARRLADSRSFMASTTELDPSASDFRTRMIDKIKSAVQSDSGLAARSSNGNGGAGRGIGQGSHGQQSGLTGVAAGRALHRERKATNNAAAQNTTN